MKKYFYILLFLSNISVFAQKPSAQVKNLADKITTGIKNDSLKVRAIYDWMTDNIAYDVPLFRKIGRKSAEEFVELQQPEQVLASKKAVCMGYSILFKDLCNAAGIKAAFISGYSKTVEPQTNRPNIPESLHAWNAVKLNQKWYLCDVTWSAGAVDMNEGQFLKTKNEAFYLTNNSQEFAKRHLPFDPIWQLSSEPLTMREFRLYAELPPNRMNPSKLNYLDSLKVFEMQDPENQKINSYRRALQFDRSNDEAKASIGYYYSIKAGKTAQICNDLVMSFMNKNTNEDYKRAIENRPKITELLADAEKEMRLARYYYIQIPPNSKYSNVAEANKQNSEMFLANINQNRANLGKYYDFVKTRVK
jgi:transglutaminase/protease-like cytokinesis protein 3